MQRIQTLAELLSLPVGKIVVYMKEPPSAELTSSGKTMSLTVVEPLLAAAVRLPTDFDLARLKGGYKVIRDSYADFSLLHLDRPDDYSTGFYIEHDEDLTNFPLFTLTPFKDDDILLKMLRRLMKQSLPLEFFYQIMQTNDAEAE